MNEYQERLYESIKKRCEGFLGEELFWGQRCVLLEEWCATLKPPVRDSLGGRFTFKFIPSGCGTSIEVSDFWSGTTVDLSDADSW